MTGPATVPAVLLHADAAAFDFVRVVMTAGLGALVLVMLIGAVMALVHAAKAAELARADENNRILLQNIGRGRLA